MQPGVLALWNDCRAGCELEYERWYQTEHLYERLAVRGILRGRRYESLAPGPGYFSYYETESAEVLQSPEYLHCLNNPSELTSRVMSGSFINMNRTVCQRLMSFGRYRGSHALTLRFTATTAITPEKLQVVLAGLERQTAVARAEFWSAADEHKRPLSAEENIRATTGNGGDSTIAACIFVETLRESALPQIQEILVGQLAHRLSDNLSIGHYRLLCELSTD